MGLRLAAAILLYLTGLGGLVVGIGVQLEPEWGAAFLPPDVDTALIRTFLVTDLLFLGVVPLVAARGLIRGWDRGYAALCIYLGASGFAAAWAWTAVATADFPGMGAVISTPGPLVALGLAVALRPSRAAARFPHAASQTTPTSRLVVLFDGSCGFCRASVARLTTWTTGAGGATKFEALSLHDPSVPNRFPGLPHDALMRAMHTVEPNGRVRDGVEALLVAASTRRGFGALPWLYRLPGVAVTVDVLYALIARYRQRISGASCKDGQCTIQLPKESPTR